MNKFLFINELRIDGSTSSETVLLNLDYVVRISIDAGMREALITMSDGCVFLVSALQVLLIPCLPAAEAHGSVKRFPPLPAAEAAKAE